MRNDSWEPRLTQWVHGYFPKEWVSIIAGKRGGGKSLFIAWLATQASQGRRIDAQGRERSAEPLHILINTSLGEDPVFSGWHPRMIAAGADRNYVEVTEYQWLLPGSAGDIRREVQKREPKPSILVLDTLGGHFRNPYAGFERNRDALHALLAIARTMNMAIVLLHHFRKGRASTTESAIGGMGVLQNFSKAIYVVGQYPDATSSTHVLACERINAARPPSLSFERLTASIEIEGRQVDVPFFEYTGPVPVSADEVYLASRQPTAGRGPNAQQQVADFCRTWMRENGLRTDDRGGLAAKVADLENAARTADLYFSKGTFERGRALANLLPLTDEQARQRLGLEYLFASDGRLQHWLEMPDPMPDEDEE